MAYGFEHLVVIGIRGFGVVGEIQWWWSLISPVVCIGPVLEEQLVGEEPQRASAC